MYSVRRNPKKTKGCTKYLEYKIIQEKRDVDDENLRVISEGGKRDQKVRTEKMGMLKEGKYKSKREDR
jgi:hypothetical protein